MISDSVRKWSAATYLLYCIAYDCGLFAGCAYLVFWRDHSGWWFVLAILLASMSYKPERWFCVVGGSKLMADL